MSQPHHSRLLALDGLRAVSILLVVISHAWLGHLVPGGLGVTIFFFISGFIITRLMLQEFDQHQKIDIRQFYLRRLFRLMPALVVYVGCSLLAMKIEGEPIRWVELGSVFFYFANYFAIFFGFSSSVMPSPLSITWSLAVEEHFYLVFPFIFALLASNTKSFLRLILTACVAVLLWRCYLVMQIGLEHLPQDRIYKATDTRLDSILYGTGFSVLTHHYSKVRAFFFDRRVFLVGIILMLVSLLIRDDRFRETLRYSIQGIGLACTFNYLIFSDHPISQFFSSKLMVYIGRISYSLYLYHYLVLAVITAEMPDAPLPLRMVVMAVASFLAAHCSYRWIEQYFLQLHRRLMISAN